MPRLRRSIARCWPVSQASRTPSTVDVLDSQTLILLLVLVAGASTASAQRSPDIPSANTVSQVWVADQGDGTYRNPIINADYSDPDVIRVGDDFYLVASSFNCAPGLPVLQSHDLVNWTIIGHALPRQPPEEVF